MGRSRDLDLVCAARALDVARTLPEGAKIFINLAPATLMDAAFSAHDLVRLAEERGVPRGSIVFEITDRTGLRAAPLAQRVHDLQVSGFVVALDDVGAGSSDLEMMRLIHYSYLKIDQSVIVAAVGGGVGRAIILAVLAFASETGALVIAEGIETRAMLKAVKLYSHEPFLIPAVQGYLFGRPEPSVERYLAQARHQESTQRRS
jgi:EAL domain-containing protein (putative c-di-GMP-specific phosphodiesterase class I)